MVLQSGQKSPKTRISFGQKHPKPPCAVSGCNGDTGFWHCNNCNKYSCGRHYSGGLLSLFNQNKCPLCGSSDVEKA